MLIKAIGVLMIIAGSSGIGFRLSRDMKNRLDELKYLRKIILMLRGEIKYAKTPLPEAFGNIGARISEPFHLFLISVSEEMNQMAGHTLQEIWKKKVDENLKTCNLTKKDLEMLGRLGEQLGYLDQEMQLGTIDLFLEQLESEIKSLEQNISTKSRIYNCLGVMGGILITIIML